MAQEYIIRIQNETGGDNRTPVSTQPQQTEGTPTAKPEQVEASQADGGGGGIANVLVSTNVIKPYLDQAISFYVSQISMDTGSERLQRKTEAFSSIASSVSAMVVAGAAGGAVGFLASGAVMATQALIQGELQKLAIANQRRFETENISLRRSRLGMSANRSRGGGTV